MTAQIIDGKKIAQEIKQELVLEVNNLKSKGIVPGLATVLVGTDPSSQIYIRNKLKSCEEVGIYSYHQHLPADTSEDEVLSLIEKMNNDPKIHGILVQLPLPGHIDADKILLAINPDKDVDGFHPVNMGRMASKKTMKEIEEEGIFLPCTPYGIIQLIKRSGFTIAGAEAVVVGRSNIVGKPLATLLLAENATVTICHTGTKNLAEVTRKADILIAATGKAKMITADMVKEETIVIDVGVNRLPDGEICGDVDFNRVKEKVKAITPVPGGVGPMTIAMLMVNTVKAAKKAAES